MAIDDNERWWNRRRTLAAQLVAEDELTDEQIAERCGRKRAWLSELKHDQRFQLRVKGILDQLRAAVAGRGIVERINRVAAQNERWQQLEERRKNLQRIIDERAAAAATGDWADVPGMATGMVVHELKAAGRRTYDAFVIDNALLAELGRIEGEMRALEKQAAQDMGQWTEKQELAGKDGKPIAITTVYTSVPRPV